MLLYQHIYFVVNQEFKFREFPGSPAQWLGLCSSIAGVTGWSLVREIKSGKSCQNWKKKKKSSNSDRNTWFLFYVPNSFMSQTVSWTSALITSGNSSPVCHSLFYLESEVAQLCPTLCDPIDCSPPAFFVHGIFQARILGLPFSSPGYLSDPEMELQSPTFQSDSILSEPTGNPYFNLVACYKCGLQ